MTKQCKQRKGKIVTEIGDNGNTEKISSKNEKEREIKKRKNKTSERARKGIKKKERKNIW